MSHDEINELIEKAKNARINGEFDKAKSYLIKAVRMAEEKMNTVSGFEKFKITLLINQLNTIIKEIDGASEPEETE
ncbi:MAG: hypothetical protein ACP6IP_08410 [Candidatus Njordarchaeia archaeon]